MTEYAILSCCGPQLALAEWFKVMGWIKCLEINPNEIVMSTFSTFVCAQGLQKSFLSVYHFYFRAWKQASYCLASFPAKIELQDCELLGSKTLHL